MTSRHAPSRWALWAFVAALLMKAAMPLLASASAHSQGKALVEICSVYGVSVVALEAGRSEPAPVKASPHGDDHCALTALASLALPEPPQLAPLAHVLLSAFDVPRLQHEAIAFDASAAWAARLGHGPPSIV